MESIPLEQEAESFGLPITELSASRMKPLNETGWRIAANRIDVADRAECAIRISSSFVGIRPKQF
jgi:hypothetical protein